VDGDVSRLRSELRRDKGGCERTVTEVNRLNELNGLNQERVHRHAGACPTDQCNLKPSVLDDAAANYHELFA
jgi:hypothetical protein